MMIYTRYILAFLLAVVGGIAVYVTLRVKDFKFNNKLFNVSFRIDADGYMYSNKNVHPLGLMFFISYYYIKKQLRGRNNG